MLRVSREIDFVMGTDCSTIRGSAPARPQWQGVHHHRDGRIGSAGNGDELEIKRVVSRWIDEQLDHRMLLRRDDPAVPLLEQLGEPVFLMDVNPTAENIAKLIFDYAAAQGFPVVEVRLWETVVCSATYSPASAKRDGGE